MLYFLLGDSAWEKLEKKIKKENLEIDWNEIVERNREEK